MTFCAVGPDFSQVSFRSHKDCRHRPIGRLISDGCPGSSTAPWRQVFSSLPFQPLPENCAECFKGLAGASPVDEPSLVHVTSEDQEGHFFFSGQKPRLYQVPS